MRGVPNAPRGLAIYTLRTYSQQTLAEIGNNFQVSNYSTVRTVVERTKRLLKEDETVGKLFMKIGLRLQVGQRPT